VGASDGLVTADLSAFLGTSLTQVSTDAPDALSAPTPEPSSAIEPPSPSHTSPSVVYDEQPSVVPSITSMPTMPTGLTGRCCRCLAPLPQSAFVGVLTGVVSTADVALHWLPSTAPTAVGSEWVHLSDVPPAVDNSVDVDQVTLYTDAEDAELAQLVATVAQLAPGIPHAQVVAALQLARATGDSVDEVVSTLLARFTPSPKHDGEIGADRLVGGDRFSWCHPCVCLHLPAVLPIVTWLDD
jgi:hypothetical protein